jgi:hypothetical protein
MSRPTLTPPIRPSFRPSSHFHPPRRPPAPTFPCCAASMSEVPPDDVHTCTFAPLAKSTCIASTCPCFAANTSAVRPTVPIPTRVNRPFRAPAQVMCVPWCAPNPKMRPLAPPGGAAGLSACLIPVGGGQRVVRTTRPCSGPLDRSQVRGHPAGEPSRAPPEVINGQIDWILKSGVRSTLLWRWTRGRTWVSYVSRRARTSQGRWREPTNAPLLSNGKQTTQRRGRRRRGVIDQEAEQQNFCWRQILVLAA